MAENDSANLLSNQASPFLQQHANNPVYWRPWSQEAFDIAAEQDKPVFLSIGYTTCHWCHIMEKESFCDKKIAALMNEHFINILVDRQERPDLDLYFLSIGQMFSKSIGWPLNLFMSPDKKPFFAAAYMPKQSKLGQIGLLNLIPKVIELWYTDRDTLMNASNTAIRQQELLLKSPPEGDLSQNIFQKTFSLLEGIYDKKHGGFSHAPKFPSPQYCLFLLRYFHISDENRSLEMVENTFTHMRWGGVYDQIGQGFHRYSTDKLWKVPHFEKMLYDQALLLTSYAQVFQITKKDFYKKVCFEIIEFLDREMLDDVGGYFSAIDSDSDGIEGRYYLWNYEELERVVGRHHLDIINFFFNAQREGNIDEQSYFNILYQSKDEKLASKVLELPEQVLKQRIKEIKSLLFKERIKRTRPFVDKTILTDWNSLLLGALAYCGRIFNKKDLITKAEKLSEFLNNYMINSENRLTHRFIKGKQEIPAFLSDYAFIIWAHIELFNASLNVKFLKMAQNYLHQSMELFKDDAFGGFYYNSQIENPGIFRQKEFVDGSLPSGNSIMLGNLIYFYYLTADNKYKKMADSMIQQVSGLVEKHPLQYCHFLSNLFTYHGYHLQVILTGNVKSEEGQNMIALVNQYFAFQLIIIPKNAEMMEIAPFLEKYPDSEKPVAYVCRDFVCQNQVDSLQDLRELLDSVSKLNKQQ